MQKLSHFKKFSLLSAALVMSACSHGTSRVSETPTPQQLCEVTTLAAERNSAMRTIDGVDVEGNARTNTVLSSKLKRYEADLEISYRSMVSSCNLYANCLDRHKGREDRCTRSENNYSDAQDQFYQMVRDADRLAADVRRAHHRVTRQQPVQSRCAPGCSTTANIFTTDCCPIQ